MALPGSAKAQDRVTARAHHPRPACEEPPKKHTRRGSRARVVEIHRQPEIALFERAPACALEQPHLVGGERPPDRHVMMAIGDGRVNFRQQVPTLTCAANSQGRTGRFRGQPDPADPVGQSFISASKQGMRRIRPVPLLKSLSQSST